MSDHVRLGPMLPQDSSRLQRSVVMRSTADARDTFVEPVMVAVPTAYSFVPPQAAASRAAAMMTFMDGLLSTVWKEASRRPDDASGGFARFHRDDARIPAAFGAHL